MSESALKVGDVVSNGAHVLAIKPGSYPHSSVVLCYWPESYDRFVVWTYYDETKSCVTGDYYQDIIKAVTRFESRGY